MLAGPLDTLMSPAQVEEAAATLPAVLCVEET
jgi:hypothetical protein